MAYCQRQQGRNQETAYGPAWVAERRSDTSQAWNRAIVLKLNLFAPKRLLFGPWRYVTLRSVICLLLIPIGSVADAGSSVAQ